MNAPTSESQPEIPEIVDRYFKLMFDAEIAMRDTNNSADIKKAHQEQVEIMLKFVEETGNDQFINQVVAKVMEMKKQSIQYGVRGLLDPVDEIPHYQFLVDALVRAPVEFKNSVLQEIADKTNDFATSVSPNTSGAESET